MTSEKFSCMSFHDKVAAVYMAVSFLVCTTFSAMFYSFNIPAAITMGIGSLLFVLSLVLLFKSKCCLAKSFSILTSYILTYTQMTFFFPKVTQFHLLYIALLIVLFTIYEINSPKAGLYILSTATVFLITSLSFAVAPATYMTASYNPATLVMFNCTTYASIYIGLTVILFYFSTEMHRIRVKLTILATQDPLTGLGNRRMLLDTGTQLATHSISTGTHFALLMVDIDDFKMINDSYGHMGGDQVLVQLAHIFRKHLRPTDLASRYGGEEFALLLPDTDEAHASRIADRLCCIVAETPFTLADHGLTHITISIGVSVFNHCSPDFDTLMSRADSALYEAKSAGKNQFKSLVLCS